MIPPGKLIHRQVFSSWGAFLVEAAKPPAVSPSQSRDGEDPHLQPGWHGGTFDEVMHLAAGGWQEGLAEVRTITAGVADGIASMIERVDWAYDVEPCNLDVARYLDGEPECWLVPDVKHIAGQGRLISIAFNGSASAHFTPRELYERGSAVMALVDLLERSGHSVRLTWVEAVHDRTQKSRSEVILPIKDYGELLNAGRTVFALAHAGMLRRLLFSVQEHWSEELRETFHTRKGGGFGTPCALSDDIQGDIRTPELLASEKIDDVPAWIRQQLQAQGISFKEEVEQ